MFHNVAEQCGGRELALKNEITSEEVGVSFTAGDLLAIYAFPDRERANLFKSIAATQAVYQTGRVCLCTEFYFEELKRDQSSENHEGQQ